MINISNSTSSELESANAKDTFNFTSTLVSELTLNPKGDNVRVFLNLVTYTEDPNNVLMTTVEFFFQVFVIDTLTEYIGSWKCYRAKNFSCSNSSIKMELRRLETPTGDNN